MQMEHTTLADAQINFRVSWCGLSITTTSEFEYYFVVDQKRALGVLKRTEWENMRTPLEYGYRPVCELQGSFSEEQHAVNERLVAAGDSSGRFDTALLIACRLFTGPCGCKYVRVLRSALASGGLDLTRTAGLKDKNWNKAWDENVQKRLDAERDESSGVGGGGGTAAADDNLEELCKGNAYPTTLYYVNLGLWKLSQLSRAVPVYCAPANNPLPHSFFTAAETQSGGIRGTVQLGNISFTTDKQEAVDSAARFGSALLLEVQGSSLARGADVSWFTQAPRAEVEEGTPAICYPPFMTCDVVTTRVEGGHIFVELRPGGIGCGAKRGAAAPRRE
jgi:hypothetical protein